MVRRNLAEALGKMRRINPKLRFLLTVSPVPLTATNSGNYVAAATTYSKSVLRAVAGELAKYRPHIVDYFPSYELITGCQFRGMFFEPNLRDVNQTGVDFVMNTFFTSMPVKTGPAAKIPPRPEPNGTRIGNISPGKDAIDVACEEQLLEAFGKKIA